MNNLPLDPSPTPLSMAVTAIIVGILVFALFEIRHRWNNRSKK